MARKKVARRRFLQLTGMAAAGAVIGGCAQAATPQVVKETVEVVVTKEVEKVVTKEVEKVVEVTPAPPTGPTNALGVTLPADALPLEKQYVLEPIGEVGGGYGHIMESLYNRAFEHFGGTEPLTSLDINLQVYPVACESWQVSEDGLYWDFKLRKELVFSDGKPITAHDWVFTLRRAMSSGYDFGWFYFDIKNAVKVYNGELPPEELGIEAVDDYTLRIYTEKPTPYLPALGVWFAVAPKHAYEQYGENWALDPQKYISSGPFILTKFERGVGHKWELNPNYKGIRRPYIVEIREENLPKGLPAYIAGDIQRISIDANSPAGERALVNANPILRTESHPQPPTNTDYIGFNTLPGKFPPLDNPDVRLALCKAIDKETLVSEIFQGFAEPAWGILPKGFPNYIGEQLKELDPNVYDPEAARQLLAKAGYPDGKGFPVFGMWIRQPDASRMALCEAIQARWKENLGITVELRPSDFQSFTDTAFKQKNAPIYFVNYSLDYYDPATFLNIFRTGGRHPHEDPEWTAFYDEANAIMDPEKRFALLQEAEKRLVLSVAYYFVESPFGIMLWPCNLKGETVQPNKDGYQFYGGGGVGCFHAYEGMYWADPACRAGLR